MLQKMEDYTTSSPFSFYEVVKILGSNTGEFCNCIGFIRAMAEENGIWYYTVVVEKFQDPAIVTEHDIKTMGYCDLRPYLYYSDPSRPRIKVSKYGKFIE